MIEEDSLPRYVRGHAYLPGDDVRDVFMSPFEWTNTLDRMRKKFLQSALHFMNQLHSKVGDIGVDSKNTPVTLSNIMSYCIDDYVSNKHRLFNTYIQQHFPCKKDQYSFMTGGELTVH